ncbi:MAG: hypothetical protein ACRENH_03480, partial [Gemmatimonadaceae bacterium]
VSRSRSTLSSFIYWKDTMQFARCAMTAFAVAGLAAGCGTHAVKTPRSHVTAGAPTSTVVSAQELARVLRQGSLMDALEQLRPSMLASRGTTPWVKVDGSPPAELSILRMIPTSEVREVRLLRSSSCVGYAIIAPNGDVIVADLIVVTTKQGGRWER